MFPSSMHLVEPAGMLAMTSNRALKSDFPSFFLDIGSGRHRVTACYQAQSG